MQGKDPEQGEIILAYHGNFGFMYTLHVPPPFTKAPGFYLQVVEDGLHMFGMEEDHFFEPPILNLMPVNVF
uniref:Uncharacterized protein n=1 Tax=viral metagenome TaxID=1070528 RepID=A0A6M3MAG3_9ZZZZ